jgi:hypothetical protein
VFDLSSQVVVLSYVLVYATPIPAEFVNSGNMHRAPYGAYLANEL